MAIAPINKGRVLVVEDDAEMRAVITRELTNEGYAVTQAEDGVEAAEKMTLETVDLVITDVRMPRMGGLALLDVVKERWPQVPVIVITALENWASFSDAYRQGAFACIQKPFAMRNLKHAVWEASQEKEGPANG